MSASVTKRENAVSTDRNNALLADVATASIGARPIASMSTGLCVTAAVRKVFLDSGELRIGILLSVFLCFLFFYKKEAQSITEKNGKNRTFFKCSEISYKHLEHTAHNAVK